MVAISSRPEGGRGARTLLRSSAVPAALAHTDPQRGLVFSLPQSERVGRPGGCRGQRVVLDPHWLLRNWEAGPPALRGAALGSQARFLPLLRLPLPRGKRPPVGSRLSAVRQVQFRGVAAVWETPRPPALAKLE